MVCRAAKPADPDTLRPDGRESTDALVLSIGCGARARCGTEADGIVAPTPHNLHVLPYPPPGSVEAVVNANRKLGYTITVGALGSIAHAAGMRTAALGNMDADRPDRSAYLLMMDQNGSVDDAGTRLGKVSPIDTAPYGITCNNEALLGALRGAFVNDTMRIIVLGDLSRADKYAALCSKPVAAQHRATALTSVNNLLNQIVTLVRSEHGSRIILFSPAPADSTASSQDRFAPVVIWGDGISPGSITSDSTRRVGLISNADILATVAGWTQQPLPPGATGRSIRGANSLESLETLHANLVMDAEHQNLLGGLPTLQLVLALSGFLLLMPIARAWTIRGRALAAIGAMIAGLPLGMLLLPVFRTGIIGAIFILGIWTFGCAAAGWRTHTDRTVTRALFATLVAAVFIDLTSGGRLLQHAWMSYSASDGSRFYGIGNEYMGAVTGALIVLTSAAFMSQDPAPRIRRYWLTFAAWCTVMLAMTLPFLGAKAGALPSLGIPFIFMAGTLRGKRIRAIAAAAAVLLIGLAAAFSDRMGRASHISRALSGAGGDSVLHVFVRKLAMEARLLVHSPWTATMAVCILGLYLTRDRGISRGRANLTTMWMLAAAAVAVAFNDAGVIAAALILLAGAADHFTTSVSASAVAVGQTPK